MRTFTKVVNSSRRIGMKTNSVKVLLEYADLSTITVAAVIPDNLARVGIDGSIDLDSILRELVVAVKAPKEVRTGCRIVLKPCTAKTRDARSNASRI